jgi:hypothetical protein
MFMALALKPPNETVEKLKLLNFEKQMSWVSPGKPKNMAISTFS